MGYLHIDNLYKNQTVLAFRRCFALEKVHGTSAHIAWRDGKVHLSPGGESAERFAALFDVAALTATFTEIGHDVVTVYGEAYGGKQQGMSATYGKSLAFIVFDVQVGETWLAVPNAVDVAERLGLEFVPHIEGPADIGFLDQERDADSEVAIRRGIGPGKKREGIVIRPLVEFTDNRGNRVIAKHKRDEFRETATPRTVVDPARQKVLDDADAIAQEWVTDMRLRHVLDKLGAGVGMERTRDVITAMVEDVEREAAGEIVMSAEARKAISSRAAAMFKATFQAALRA